MAEDPLKDLPRLGDEALGHCAFCDKVMLATGLPLFYRFTVQQCGIDAKAVREKVGLATMFGGGADGLALAGIMGPGTKPVVVMSSGEINVCMACAEGRTDLLALVDKTADDE